MMFGMSRNLFGEADHVIYMNDGAIRVWGGQTLTRSRSMKGRSSGRNAFSVTKSTGQPSRSSSMS